jgi:anthranilate phosphoribosyltransferase
MKYAIGPRREIGIRTIFNMLGPLTNPAGATAQLLGVYDPKLTEMFADEKYGNEKSVCRTRSRWPG